MYSEFFSYFAIYDALFIFHTLSLGLQGVEHCGLVLCMIPHFQLYHSVSLLSVYCDKIGKYLLCSINVWYAAGRGSSVDSLSIKSGNLLISLHSILYVNKYAY